MNSNWTLIQVQAVFENFSPIWEHVLSLHRYKTRCAHYFLVTSEVENYMLEILTQC